MRIAFIDLYFSWPPRGGAPVDLYHVIAGLQAGGHDVKLFFADNPDNLAQGTVDASQLPFPSEPIAFTARNFVPREVTERFSKIVDAWRPQAIFHGLGFFTRPFLFEALGHYPSVGRCYAYEFACPRDFRLYKDGTTCPMNYLTTPDTCRVCTLEHLAPEIKLGHPEPYTREYLATRAYLPSYHARSLRGLRALKTLIVSNRIAQGHFDGIHPDVRIIPGGVTVGDFDPAAPEPAHAKKVIFMPGRADDPAKGLDVLRRAGERLAAQRPDFEVRVTHTDYTLNRDWFRCIGWHDAGGMAALYREADVCVVPSLWDEPFGLVALEAMVSGRPVCASRVGGLQELVREGETGFLHERGDDAGLASQLERLLDDSELRCRMGEAGRRRAESEHDWDRVIETHYEPLLEDLKP